MHDRYSKNYDHSLENRYKPSHFDPAMYENKAAVIAQRWDSHEQLDSKITTNTDPTGRPTSSSKKPTPALTMATHTRYLYMLGLFAQGWGREGEP